MIGIAVALVLVAGPLLLGLSGLYSTRGAPADAVPEPGRAWHWKLTINSALLYALAFNLTFFIQALREIVWVIFDHFLINEREAYRSAL